MLARCSGAADAAALRVTLITLPMLPLFAIATYAIAPYAAMPYRAAAMLRARRQHTLPADADAAADATYNVESVSAGIAVR